jgi:hypothetical protein
MAESNYTYKDNTFALFQNKFKEQPNQPDFIGKAMVDGVMKDVSLWVKQTKAGEDYFSGIIKKEWVAPNQGQGNAPKPSYRAPRPSAHSDDPF